MANPVMLTYFVHYVKTNVASGYTHYQVIKKDNVNKKPPRT